MTKTTVAQVRGGTWTQCVWVGGGVAGDWVPWNTGWRLHNATFLFPSRFEWRFTTPAGQWAGGPRPAGGGRRGKWVAAGPEIDWPPCCPPRFPSCKTETSCKAYNEDRTQTCMLLMCISKDYIISSVGFVLYQIALVKRELSFPLMCKVSPAITWALGVSWGSETVDASVKNEFSLAGLTLRDALRCLDIHEEVKVKVLFLWVRRNQPSIWSPSLEAWHWMDKRNNDSAGLFSAN